MIKQRTLRISCILGIFCAGLPYFRPAIAAAQSVQQSIPVLTTRPAACEDDPECRIHCGPETACRKYYAAYCRLFDRRDWETYNYKLFAKRFSDRGWPTDADNGKRKVKIKVPDTITQDTPPLEPISLRDWYFSYRYRELHLDKEKAWKGMYEMFWDERKIYLNGYQATKNIYKTLMTRLVSQKEFERELNQPAAYLLPSVESTANLKLLDLIYIYQGGEGDKKNEAVDRLNEKKKLLGRLEHDPSLALSPDGRVDLKPGKAVALKDYFGPSEIATLQEKARADRHLKSVRKQLDAALKQADRQAESEIGKLLHEAAAYPKTEDNDIPAVKEHTFLEPKASAPPSEPKEN